MRGRRTSAMVSQSSSQAPAAGPFNGGIVTQIDYNKTIILSQQAVLQPSVQEMLFLGGVVAGNI
jgi:hypothetical protein